MFVFRVTYIASPAEVEALVPAHVAWLEEHHAAGRFVISGQTIPDTDGGVILVRGDDRAEAEALAAGDPFVVGGVTRTEVIQFNASQTAPGFSSSSR